MKKEPIKNQHTSNGSLDQSKRKQVSPKEKASDTVERVDTLEYSKAISYMLSLEEFETQMMIASASTVSNRQEVVSKAL